MKIFALLLFLVGLAIASFSLALAMHGYDMIDALLCLAVGGVTMFAPVLMLPRLFP